LLLIPIQLAMLLPALAKAKGKAQQIQCMNNLKQLGLAAMLYSSDNDDRLPPAANWNDTIAKYVPNQSVLTCVADRPGGAASYAYNVNLAGVKTSQLTTPMATVLFFEAEAGPNAAGGSEKALRNPRHGSTVGIAFCDGHVEMVPVQRLDQLKWTP
jgi:prepilin-type processing-associated H-X9-DG protein